VVLRFVFCILLFVCFVRFFVLCGDFDVLWGFVCPIFVNSLYLLRLEEILGS
jgi:hypothetical protein